MRTKKEHYQDLHVKSRASSLEAVSKPGDNPPSSVLRKSERAKLRCLNADAQRSKPSLRPVPRVSKRTLSVNRRAALCADALPWRME